ncbi:MAG: TetR/AcrR family transcriptional regulator [bacterium]|nr:TetR/AcrR family transcriptional regulator [bacterium]
MPKKRLSQEERRTQIIEVAMALFASKGFKGTTTRAIAKQADVSEAIIFRHFATKEDLYDAIINYTIEQRQKLWDEEEAPVGPDQDLKSLLKEFAWTFIQRNREDQTFIRLMLYSALEDHKFREKFFAIYQNPQIRAIREVLSIGVEKGLFRPMDHPFVARSFLWILIQYCISNFVANNTPPDSDEDKRNIDELVNIYVLGLESSSGETSLTDEKSRS